MYAKPKSLTMIGIVQVLLAVSFVIWLLFFPDTAGNFAWPVTPRFTALFIGAGFIARTMIGFFLWRSSTWQQLRWQAKANLAFLIVIFVATLWHINEMNWKTNIIVAHIWVIAYVVEPVLLFLIEPRSPDANAPLPVELRRGPILAGLKRVMGLGLVITTTIGGLAFINPKFLDTRWPWTLDPFNARIMAAFFALAALWCVTVYFAEDWGEIRLAMVGLLILAVSNSIIWLIVRTQFDPAKKNSLAYGIGFIGFSALLIYYYWKQERLHRGVKPGQQ